jgi:hypothetical protein
MMGWRCGRGDLVARAAPFLARGVIWDLEHFGHAHPFFAHSW